MTPHQSSFGPTFNVFPHGTKGRLLTIQQVADALSVSRSLVYAEVKRGKLPVRRVGKAIRVFANDLDIYLAECDQDAGTDTR